MDESERQLWRSIDVGGYAAYGTLFAFTLEGLKKRVESDAPDIQEVRDRLTHYFKNLADRFQAMNLSKLDNRFPVAVLKEVRDQLIPEMATKFKELDALLKHFLSGASHLKMRIGKKIDECQALVTRMGELGQEFSKNPRYWEYRKTNPERDYLEKPEV